MGLSWAEFTAKVEERHHGCTYPPIFRFIEDRDIKYLRICLGMIGGEDLMPLIPGNGKVKEPKTEIYFG